VKIDRESRAGRVNWLRKKGAGPELKSDRKVKVYVEAIIDKVATKCRDFEREK
jgi:hypothetical protein